MGAGEDVAVGVDDVGGGLLLGDGGRGAGDSRGVVKSASWREIRRAKRWLEVHVPPFAKAWKMGYHVLVRGTSGQRNGNTEGSTAAVAGDDGDIGQEGLEQTTTTAKTKAGPPPAVQDDNVLLWHAKCSS